MFYFPKDKAQERYNIEFSLRKVSNGKWIDYNFFDLHHFEFSLKLDNLGWKSMTIMRDDVYPNLVAHFYANSTREYNSDSIDSHVKRVEFTLDISVIKKF